MARFGDGFHSSARRAAEPTIERVSRGARQLGYGPNEARRQAVASAASAKDGASDGMPEAATKSTGSASATRHKKSFSIPCASAFRDRVLALAARRGVNAGDLARSVMLLLPPTEIAGAADPGDPAPDDRETVTLRSGPSKGKPWRRKPRLQVRLPGDQDPILLRKALGLALDLDEGRLHLSIDTVDAAARDAAIEADRRALDRLRDAVRTVADTTLGHPVRTRDEALFVLGFPPGARPEPAAIKTRYRMLATIHHPDSDTGDTDRMARLNQAMSFMRGYEKNRFS
jgi:hypothetical protein